MWKPDDDGESFPLFVLMHSCRGFAGCGEGERPGVSAQLLAVKGLALVGGEGIDGQAGRAHTVLRWAWQWLFSFACAVGGWVVEDVLRRGLNVKYGNGKP